MPQHRNIVGVPPGRSDFTIVGSGSVGRGYVKLIDNDGRVSVTNDAENVVRQIAKIFGADRAIYYRDTDGNWGELKHNAGQFTGFAHLGYEP